MELKLVEKRVEEAPDMREYKDRRPDPVVATFRWRITEMPAPFEIDLAELRLRTGWARRRTITGKPHKEDGFVRASFEFRPNRNLRHLRGEVILQDNHGKIHQVDVSEKVRRLGQEL